MQTEFVDAIEHIYADMDGGGRWPDILRSLCQLLDADAGIMFTALFGPETLTSDVLHDGRVVFSHGAKCCDPHMRTYGQKFCRTDSLAIEVFRNRNYKSGYVAPVDSLLDKEVFETSEFYKGWHKAIGAPTALFACISGEDDGQAPNAHLVFYRRHGRAAFNRGDAEDLLPLMYHLRQSFALENSLRQKAEIAQAVERARGRGRCGVAVLDIDGSILHMDKLLKTILEENDGLVCRHGRIRALSVCVDRQLQDAIALCAAGGWSDAGNSTEPSVVKVEGDETMTVVQVSPFPESQAPMSRPMDRLRRRVILRFFVERAVVSPNFRSNIESAFGLTPSETRFAGAFMQYTSVAKAACACEISDGTARNVLKSIYRKSYTGNQAALIKLMMQYA